MTSNYTIPNGFIGAAIRLTDDDLAAESSQLECEVAMIRAIDSVESGGSGFLPDNRPKILFESHQFHVLTRGKFDGSHPGISTSSWVRNYGASGAHQYDRLAEAMTLDHDAALEAASWGRYQLMGLNFRAGGYSSIDDMIYEFCADEKFHLSAFGLFCENVGIVEPLQERNWSRVALLYNGSGQVSTYANLLERAYSRFAVPGASTADNPNTIRAHLTEEEQDND
jgi:hypothetical protein